MTSVGAKGGVIRGISRKEEEQVKEAKLRFFYYLFVNFQGSIKEKTHFFNKARPFFSREGESWNATPYKTVWLRILIDPVFLLLEKEMALDIKSKSPFSGKMILCEENFGDFDDKTGLAIMGRGKITEYCLKKGINGKYCCYVVVIPEPKNVEVFRI
ncbi:MAG: hypothetical protein V1851_00200 [Patescibacteria group bacterium]